VRYTWQELKPLLNPGFHPEVLPKPIAKQAFDPTD
jgi:hypothetical protein